MKKDISETTYDDYNEKLHFDIPNLIWIVTTCGWWGRAMKLTFIASDFCKGISKALYSWRFIIYLFQLTLPWKTHEHYHMIFYRILVYFTGFSNIPNFIFYRLFLISLTVRAQALPQGLSVSGCCCSLLPHFGRVTVILTVICWPQIVGRLLHLPFY